VFSTRYACERGGGDYSDVVTQFTNVYNNMYDSQKRLYYHGWDYSKSAFWADKQTGLSKSFWLRADGWYTVGLVDAISYMTDAVAKEKLSEIFRTTIEGLEQYIDPVEHMFYQVIDKGGR